MLRVSSNAFGFRVETDTLQVYAQQIRQAEQLLSQSYLLLMKVIYAFQIQLSGPQAAQAARIISLAQAIMRELLYKQTRCRDLAEKLYTSTEMYQKCEKNVASGFDYLKWTFQSGELHLGFNASEKARLAVNTIYSLGLFASAIKTIEVGVIFFSKQILQVKKQKVVPTSASYQKVPDLLQALYEVKREKDLGHLEVIKHQQNGHTAWTVLVPGTQTWAFFARNPQNLGTNIHTNRNLPNIMERAIDQSLIQAGYRVGEPLELVGHSQGGAVAAGFARRYTHKYNIRSVVAAGSNLGRVSLPAQVKLLAIENVNDIVPGLDRYENPKAKNITTVKVHDPAKNCHPTIKQHDLQEYRRLSSLENFSSQKEVQQWQHNRERELGINFQRKTNSTSYQFDISARSLSNSSGYRSAELEP